MSVSGIKCIYESFNTNREMDTYNNILTYLYQLDEMGETDLKMELIQYYHNIREPFWIKIDMMSRMTREAMDLSKQYHKIINTIYAIRELQNPEDYSEWMDLPSMVMEKFIAEDALLDKKIFQHKINHREGYSQ